MILSLSSNSRRSHLILRRCQVTEEAEEVEDVEEEVEESADEESEEETDEE